MFDIERFANMHQITLHYPGEANVSRGWVNMSCPFCTFGDSSWHLGFNLTSGLCSCWRCGHKSGAEKLVQGLLGVSWNTASKIVQDYQSTQTHTPIEIRHVTKVELPLSCYSGLGIQHQKYLHSRGFDWERLVNQFYLHHTDYLSNLPLHIVAPIFYNNEMVNFVARDITGKAVSKYFVCPNEQAIIPRSELLYNFNPYLQVGAIVEGITDVWALGEGVFATFGTRFSNEQLQLLAQSNLKKIFVMYDGDNAGKQNGAILASQLAGVIDTIELIELEKGDPAEQDEATLQELKSLLLPFKCFER